MFDFLPFNQGLRVLAAHSYPKLTRVPPHRHLMVHEFVANETQVLSYFWVITNENFN